MNLGSVLVVIGMILALVSLFVRPAHTVLVVGTVLIAVGVLVGVQAFDV